MCNTTFWSEGSLRGHEESRWHVERVERERLEQERQEQERLEGDCSDEAQVKEMHSNEEATHTNGNDQVDKDTLPGENRCVSLRRH